MDASCIALIILDNKLNFQTPKITVKKQKKFDFQIGHTEIGKELADKEPGINEESYYHKEICS